MKHLFFGSVALLALAAAGPAVAADMPVKAARMQAAPAVPVYNWTGFYIGAGWGSGMWNQDYFMETDPAHVPTSTKLTGGGRGWLGTVTAGFDYQFNSNIVIGVFGDWDWANIKGTWLHSTANAQGTEKERWAWAVGGRVGWLLTPTLLSYFNGGYTAAHFNQIDLFTASLPVTALGTHIPAHTYHGWFLGGGVDYALPFISGLFWRNEYRYASYKAADLPILPVALRQADEAVNASKAVQTVRSELIYRFNWGGVGKGPLVTRY